MNRVTTVFKHLKFPIFLMTLLCFLIAYPFLHLKFPKQIAIVELFLAILMIVGVSLLIENKKTLIFMLTFAVLILFGILISGYTENTFVLLITMSVELMFFLVIFISLLFFIYAQKKVTLNKLYAAIISYIVLGIIFALLYALIAISLPDAFKYTVATHLISSPFPHPIFFSEALYFSFVTLGTLGYGDWVPILGPIKMIAALEAIIGQLFIAILIARLVGIQISQSLIKQEID